MMDHDIYDFYLRVPFQEESRDSIPSILSNTEIKLSHDKGEDMITCSKRRIEAFRWRWENPLELNERGPYIPKCHEKTGKFHLKQCDPQSSIR